MRPADGWLDPAGTARVRALGGAAAPGPDPIARRAVALPPAVREAAGQLDLGEGALFVAWELASLAAAPHRLPVMLLVLASLVSQSRGSTRLPLSDRGRVDEALAELGADRAAAEAVFSLLEQIEKGGLDASLSSLVGGPGDYRPLLVDGGHLYHQRMWELESRVGRRIAARLRTVAMDPQAALEPLVRDVEAAPPRKPDGSALRLSGEQRQAIKAALEGRITVISGGPGTGKTSIVVSILRALARRGDVPLEQVALAAPTGKAADRMRSSIEGALRRVEMPALADRALLSARPQARTLHRLLGYSPRSGRFRHHERNRLAEQFVVVDESSMIDLDLMDRLLGALADDAQLVLLGDARQLPSVDAGAVFRDLSERGGHRAVRLTRSYRMDRRDPTGRNIFTIAQRIDARDAAGMFEPRARSRGPAEERLKPRTAPSQIRFEGVEWIDPGTSPRGREAVLALWYARRVQAFEGLAAHVGHGWRFDEGRVHPDERAPLDALFTHFECSKILCLTRTRSTGVDAVNAWFHARMLEGGRQAGRLEARRGAFLPGEPVLVQRNDYEKGLFNGDTGLVLRARLAGDAPARRVAVFRRDDGFVAFPLEAVRPLLDRAWAMTVHKAQGSEYAHVAVVLPSSDTPLLTRELLYTAVTRSSRSVLLIGSRAMLEQGVSRALERSSGLADRIAGTN